MKKIILGLVVIGSASAFAHEETCAVNRSDIFTPWATYETYETHLERERRAEKVLTDKNYVLVEYDSPVSHYNLFAYCDNPSYGPNHHGMWFQYFSCYVHFNGKIIHEMDQYRIKNPTRGTDRRDNTNYIYSYAQKVLERALKKIPRCP